MTHATDVYRPADAFVLTQTPGTDFPYRATGLLTIGKFFREGNFLGAGNSLLEMVTTNLARFVLMRALKYRGNHFGVAC